MSQASDSSQSEPVRIYVGADRSQALALRVLEYSIRQRTRRAVEVHSLEGVAVPAPADPSNAQKTEFSFARFAIPALAGRQGKAVYLDADMLVLTDIGELWDMLLGGAHVMCQEELPERVSATSPQKGDRRKKQCSVMLLDCAALDWDLAAIVAGLGARYSYEELMDGLCIVPEEKVSYALPLRWNSLELLEKDTALIHYTDMMRQPWVFAGNSNGWKWTAELRAMRRGGAVTEAEIGAETERGLLRPSLQTELEEGGDGPHSAALIARLADIDRRARYEPHKALTRRLRPAARPGLTAAARRFARRVLTGGD